MSLYERSWAAVRDELEHKGERIAELEGANHDLLDQLTQIREMCESCLGPSGLMGECCQHVAEVILDIITPADIETENL